MYKLKHFLCFKLDTGGIILAWFGMIKHGVCIGFLIIFSFISITISCREFGSNDNKKLEHDEKCLTNRLTILWTFGVLLLYFYAIYYIYYALNEAMRMQMSPAIYYEYMALALGLTLFIICDSVLAYAIVVIANMFTVYCIWTLLSIRENIKAEALQARKAVVLSA